MVWGRTAGWWVGFHYCSALSDRMGPGRPASACVNHASSVQLDGRSDPWRLQTQVVVTFSPLRIFVMKHFKHKSWKKRARTPLNPSSFNSCNHLSCLFFCLTISKIVAEPLQNKLQLWHFASKYFRILILKNKLFCLTTIPLSSLRNWQKNFLK